MTEEKQREMEDKL